MIADLPGKRQRVIQVGGHLDSVTAGPGINDNGTGSAAILELAVQMAHSHPINTVRFSWWGAEEANLVGSDFYVNDLAANAPRELNRIKAYLNFDMVGSPNFARFIYDGNQSEFPEDLVPVPPGSAEIEALFEKFYSDRGLAFEDTAFDGRSDYQAFALAGIPAGGLFTGAEDTKTPEQAALYGGQAGEAFDPCYHQECDTIGNFNREVLRQNADAIAFATFKLANARDLPGEAASATATAEAAGRDRTGFNPHRRCRLALDGSSPSGSEQFRSGWRGAGERSSRTPARPPAGSSARRPTGSRGRWRSPRPRTTQWGRR